MNKRVQQIVVIHGGDTFATYDEYLEFLKKFEIDETIFKVGGWKATLGEKLGTDYEIFCPQLPNKFNAKYIEWKIWFEKLLPLFNDHAIYIGHSLGGLFLAKYFSEETSLKKIKALFLIAAPYDMAGSEESLADFIVSDNLTLLASQSPVIFLYHSKDDPVVPFSELQKYQTHLPSAQVRIFNNRGHFRDELPEIVEDIQKL